MIEVNVELVREFLELHDFIVYPLKKTARWSKEKERVDLLFINPRPLKSSPPFLLQGNSLNGLRKGIVKILGWHTEVFTPSLLQRSKEILQFAEEESKDSSKKFFPSSDFSRILVLSRLTRTPSLRKEAVRFLKEKGIDHILEFETILWYLIEKVEKNRNYYSDILEILRILKQYRMLKKKQLEFFNRE